MAEEDKSITAPVVEVPIADNNQLQALLKQTIKDNKILQNKNSKLQTRYVELFKEHKLLKKDHTVFVSFFLKTYGAENAKQPSKLAFKELAIGQYDLLQLQKFAEDKISSLSQRIVELQSNMDDKVKTVKIEMDRMRQEQKSRLLSEFQIKLKANKDEQTKDVNSLTKEIQMLKKSNKNQVDELTQIKVSLDNKSKQISKLSKEKLKLEHHLNNIRKKQISEQLSPQKQKQHQKSMIERNQFLSLRQQVQTLLAKRDQIKRELKECEQKLSQQRKLTEGLQNQLCRLNKIQSQLDQKYQLVRECTVEQLQNLILTHSMAPIQQVQMQQLPKTQLTSKKIIEIQKPEQNQQIQKEYLKNVLIRYIKAEACGSLDQALTLLQIIGTLMKLDNQATQALDQYKIKRKQWWNMWSIKFD